MADPVSTPRKILWVGSLTQAEAARRPQSDITPRYSIVKAPNATLMSDRGPLAGF